MTLNDSTKIHSKYISQQVIKLPNDVRRKNNPISISMGIVLHVILNFHHIFSNLH